MGRWKPLGINKREWLMFLVLVAFFFLVMWVVFG